MAQVQLLAAAGQHMDFSAHTALCAPANHPVIFHQLGGGPISSSNGLCWSAASSNMQAGQALMLPLNNQYAGHMAPPPMSQGVTPFLPSQSQWVPQQQATSTTVFFAGVAPVADGQRLRMLFGQFGRVLDLNLFRPYNGSRTSKGCGLVVFSQHSEAAAALEALNGRFVWPGARSPMVIEWCDPTKQHKRKRAQPLAHTLVMPQSAPMHHVQYMQQPLLPQQLPVVPAQQHLLANMLPLAAGQQLQLNMQQAVFVNPHML